jgi:predicted esterase
MKLISQFAVGVVVFVALARGGRGDPVPEAQEPELKTAKAVAVKYYVALPNGWNADKEWPILVTIDGSGHNFLGSCQNFVRARGDLPFIVISPFVRSNGNDPADREAVIAIVKEVQQESKGRQKLFITGFSAGGHLTWQFVFKHPELLGGAAPAAANFRFRGIDEVSKAKERVELPIHGFNGEKDAAVINAQWDDAAEHAREHGYENIAHDLVPGAGHQAFADEVVKFFADLIDK